MAAIWPLLILLFSTCSPVVVRAADEAGYTIVEIRSLESTAACSGHRVIPPHNGTWIPLNHPHGPCSPSPDTPTPSLVDLLQQDQRRFGDIHRRLSGGSVDDVGGSERGGQRSPSRTNNINGLITSKLRLPQSKPPASPASPAATGNGGLPGVVQTVVLDTASDVAWVQCVPCPVPPCHPQTDTLYNPTNSPTYAAFSCNSPACRQLGPYANGCVNNQCQYRVAYPDGSSSSGTYSSDTLTLNPTTTITNFQFGCSHADPGSFDNTTAGIMALGGGPESLVSQTAATYGNAFAYCIPPSASSKGYFLLGVPLVAASRYVVTPLLRYPRVPTFYRVLLRDIAVAGRRLNVPAAVFAPGSVMDTRTVFTRLPPTAYQALRTAFRSSMAMYRMAPPRGAFDTCYDFTGVGNVTLPRIQLVFDRNAVVELDPSGVLYNGCLAFVSNANDLMPGVLGNVQQRTFEVFFNVGGGSLGFRRTMC